MLSIIRGSTGQPTTKLSDQGGVCHCRKIQKRELPCTCQMGKEDYNGVRPREGGSFSSVGVGFGNGTCVNRVRWETKQP